MSIIHVTVTSLLANLKSSKCKFFFNFAIACSCGSNFVYFFHLFRKIKIQKKLTTKIRRNFATVTNSRFWGQIFFVH